MPEAVMNMWRLNVSSISAAPILVYSVDVQDSAIEFIELDPLEKAIEVSTPKIRAMRAAIA
jgi:hypothetical protein